MDLMVVREDGGLHLVVSWWASLRILRRDFNVGDDDVHVAFSCTVPARVRGPFRREWCEFLLLAWLLQRVGSAMESAQVQMRVLRRLILRFPASFKWGWQRLNSRG